MIGKTLGHYQITSQIGKGGMGEVFQAKDQKLGRDVAIKVLPPETITDPVRKARFVQEAKAASALNHPNIITIYDIGSDGPNDFIVMEYVAGKTLDRLIGRNGLRLKDALNYAIQITSALAKAHSADIVHRDLKPSNIMVTPDGLVKILDFGLAKLLDRGPKSGEGRTTLTADLPVTGEGTIVGTVAYMSPEQAEGRPVDARSDVFSFGSVIYEMLTGHQAFRGDTPASTLAAVIMKEPSPPGEIASGLPAEVERAVLRCLRKDPQRRWQTMSDLNVQLQDLKEESESGLLTAAPAQPSRGMKARVPAAWFSLLVILTGAGAAWWFLGRDKGSTTSRIAPVTSEMERMTFESGMAFWPAISRDGKLIAYSSDRSGSFDIYVRQLNGEAVRRTENGANDWYPCFSNDGEKIVFRSERNGGGLYLTGTLAGAEREIADRGRLASFSPRGSTIVYLVASALTQRGRMFLVDTDSGGQPRPFQQDFVIPPTGASHSPPQWSPDGEHILFQGMHQGDPNSTGWWVAPVAGGEAVRIANMPEQKLLRILVGWWGSYVYYSEGTMIGGMNLYRVPIADGPWRVIGDPERIAAPAGMQYGASASADGRMVFSTLESVPQIWAVGFKANEGITSGRLEAVTADAGGKLNLAIAANGSRLAWMGYTLQSQSSRASVSFGIHIIDFIGGREYQIPNEASPQLSADGSRLAYSSGRFAFVTDPGSTSGRQVCENCRIHAFFADASDVLVQYGNQLVRQNVAGGARVALVQTPDGIELFQAAVSPADKWVSFTVARADGMAALYLAPVGKQVAPQEKWIQVTEDPIYLGSPAWSPNGQLLYFASSRDGFICVWAQRIGADGKPKGNPFAVHHNHTAPESTQIGFASNGITPEKLYMLLFEFTGNLWTLQIKR